MIGQNLARRTRGLQFQSHKIFTDIFCQCRHACSFLCVSRIIAEHETVIFHCRPATRRGDENRIQAAAISFRQPQIDIAAGKDQPVMLLAHVMDKRAAAPLPFHINRLNAIAREQAACCCIDGRF